MLFVVLFFVFVFFFKQKTAYEIGTGDWSSDVCSSDLSGLNSNNFQFLVSTAGVFYYLSWWVFN